MLIDGIEVQVHGKWLRIAGVSEGYDYVDEPEAFLHSLRTSPLRIDLFTFIQRLSDTAPRFAYMREDDNFAVVRVTTYDEWFTRQIGNKTRNLIRKAEKSGVTVREVPFDDALVAGISMLNNESPVRQGRRFWHYGDDLDAVQRKNGSFLGRSVFLGAFLDHSLIGYVKLTSDERHEQAGLMQIMSMIRHRDKAPTNLLVAHAVRACANRGFSHLWYAKFSYKNKTPGGIADFKRHNGFAQVDVPRYYIPVTTLGRVALGLRLQNGLMVRLPESIVEHGRQLRSRWYDDAFQRAKKAG